MRRLLERFGGYIPAIVALALPIAFLPTASDSYILPRASIVIAGACLGVGLALLIPIAVPLGNLRLPVMLAVAAALLAFAFSISWPLSFAGSYTRYESLPMRVAYLGLLVTSVWLLRTQRQRDLVVAAFVFSTSVACIKAWIQWASHVPYRPDGDLGNANLLAALVVMAAPLAIDRVRHASIFQFAWGAALIPLVAGLWVTTSRSGDLGLFVGCLAVLALSVPRRLFAPVGVLAVGVVTLATFLFYGTPLRTLNGDPPELRLHLWGDGLRLVFARPLTGWGEDTTGLSFGHYLTHDYAGLVTFDRVHSGPLDVAATQGLFGLAVLGWVVGVVLWTAFRRREVSGVPGLAAALLGYSVWVFFNFDWAPATGAFWLLAGVLWNSLSPSDDRVRVRGAKEALAAVLLALVAIPLAVFPILADVWYVHGRADLAIKVAPLQAQYEWAIGTAESLRRAAALGETEPGMYVQLGDAERSLGNISAARSAYERALEIDPYYTPARQRLAAFGG